METIALAAAICLPLATITFGLGIAIGGQLEDKATKVGLGIVVVALVFLFGAGMG